MLPPTRPARWQTPVMAAPVEPRIIAETGGLVIAEWGPAVVVVDRGTGPLATVAFVLGVLAAVFGGFGGVTLVLATTSADSPPWPLGAALLVAGIVAAGGALAVAQRIRRDRAIPVSEYRPVAIFDRARRVYVDAAGAIVAPLHHVRFQRETQLTSSSSMLVAVTPAGRRIIKRGNPFNGGLGNLDAVLTAAVFRPPG